jgi:signal transduction histidine kinase
MISGQARPTMDRPGLATVIEAGADGMSRAPRGNTECLDEVQAQHVLDDFLETTRPLSVAEMFPPEPEPGDSALWRRRLRHDIRHELGTIVMIASAVAVAGDVGAASRERIEQLLGETRWLDHLLRQLDEDDDAPPMPRPDLIRVDEVAAEVVSGLRVAIPHTVSLSAQPAWAHMEALSLWRALRNVLDNACRVARGRVDLSVRTESGWVVIQVDDDGPGFGAGAPGLASLGLGIVHDLVAGYGGGLEIRHCELGGARVRLRLPAAPPEHAAAPPGGDTWT